MTDIMIMNVKKIALGAAVVFFSNFAVAQSLQDGINSIDSDKFAQAKNNFTQLVAKEATAENNFYLGNTFLRQSEPDFGKATESFNKGLALESKSYLNKIGLASVKLGKGDKSAIAEIQKIVTDSKEKDAEVLFRAAEALTLFDKNNAPDLAIQYLNKAIEKSKKGVPAYYYYTLGDAYRLKKVPGDAMSAYDKALPLAQNKASVYTRIGTLWMAAQQWQQAKTSIEKAIATDATYAPAYKAMAAYNIKYQENGKATQDLINYTKYADEDPYTLLEIAKLYFTNEDYTNSKAILDKIFDKVEDPIKYKLIAYVDYAEGKYPEAKLSMDSFVAKAEKSRVQPADQGLQGLIAAGLAKVEKDAAKKAALTTESQQKIAIAKAAKDETMKWDMELAKINGGGAISQSAVNEGPTSPAIEQLKKKVVENDKDSDALYQLANAYQEVKNWNGAILTWQKMSALLPDWAPAYYSQGYASQQAGNNEAAKSSYEKYIATVKPAEIEANKQTLSYAYFAVAYLSKEADMAKAKDYVAKSLQLDPTYQDAVKLNAEINK